MVKKSGKPVEKTSVFNWFYGQLNQNYIQKTVNG